MATILGDERTDVGGLDAHHCWRTFSASERQKMREDDIRAGMTVALILTGVIFAGLVNGLIGVMLSL